MSNPQAPGERSPAEPTMEEILASIRRIIADGKPGEREPDAPEPTWPRRRLSQRAWRRAPAPTGASRSRAPGRDTRCGRSRSDADPDGCRGRIGLDRRPGRIGPRRGHRRRGSPAVDRAASRRGVAPGSSRDRAPTATAPAATPAPPPPRQARKRRAGLNPRRAPLHLRPPISGAHSRCRASGRHASGCPISAGLTSAGTASTTAGAARGSAIAAHPRRPHDRGGRARSAGAHAAGLARSASPRDRRAPGAGGDRSHQPEVGVLSAVEVPARLPA